MQKEKKNYLKSALIEITDYCNFNCKQCYEKHDLGAVLQLNDYKSIIDELYSLGCFKICFSGGEVFTRKKLLFQLLEYAKEKEFYTSIITNLSLCTEEDVGILKARQVDAINVSLYGSCEDTYYNMCQINIDVEEIKKRIIQLKNSGMNVSVQTILTSLNIEDANDLKAWARTNEIQLVFTYNLFGREGNNKDNLQYSITSEQIKYCIETWEPNLIDDFQEIGVRKKEKDRSAEFCSGGRKQLCVAADGTIYPCATWRVPIGHVKDGLVSVWRNPNEKLSAIRTLKYSDFKCFDCEHFDKCAFCPGMNYSVTGSIYKPAKNVCNFTYLLEQMYCEKEVLKNAGSTRK